MSRRSSIDSFSFASPRFHYELENHEGIAWKEENLLGFLNFQQPVVPHFMIAGIIVQQWELGFAPNGLLSNNIFTIVRSTSMNTIEMSEYPENWCFFLSTALIRSADVPLLQISSTVPWRVSLPCFSLSEQGERIMMQSRRGQNGWHENLMRVWYEGFTAPFCGKCQ